jgi:hypothetical protein
MDALVFPALPSNSHQIAADQTFCTVTVVEERGILNRTEFQM